MADITTLGVAVDSSGVRSATSDMERLVKASESAAASLSRMEKSTDNLGGTIRTAGTEAALLAGYIQKGIDSVVHFTAEVIRLGIEVGRYQDIATKTGGDPAGLASLRTAADLAGLSVDDIARRINYLNQMIFGAGTRNTRAETALHNLNIDIEEFKKLSADQQVYRLAEAFGRFSDSTSKSANAIALWGRNGADQLILMKKIEDAGPPIIKYTNEQIHAIDQQSTAFERNRSQLRQVLQAMGTEAVPAITAFTKGFKDAAAEVLGLNQQTGKLEETRGTVRSWAFDVAESFSYLVGAAQLVADAFNVAGKAVAVSIVRMPISIEYMKNSLEEIDQKFNPMSWFSGKKHEDWEAERAKLRQQWRDVTDMFGEDISASMDRLTGKTDTAGNKIRKAIADARSGALNAWAGTGGGAGAGYNPLATMGGTGSDKTAKQTVDIYEKAMEAARRYREELDAEAETGHKLVPAEVELNRILEENAKSKVKMTGIEQMAVQITYSKIIADQKAVVATKERMKADEEARRVIERAMSTADRELQGAQRESDAAQFRLNTYGLESYQLDRLTAIRQRAAAAAKLMEAANSGAEGYGEAYNDTLRQTAAYLIEASNATDDLADVMEGRARNAFLGASHAIDEYVKSVNNAGKGAEKAVTDILQTTEDELTNLFTKGQFDVKKLIDTIISEFIRLKIVKPLLADIFGSSGGGLGYWLAKLFGAGATGGGGTVSGPGLTAPPNVWGTAAPSASRITVQQTITNHIDSSTDRAQVAGMVQQGVQAGNRQMIEAMKAHGVI